MVDGVTPLTVGDICYTGLKKRIKLPKLGNQGRTPFETYFLSNLRDTKCFSRLQPREETKLIYYEKISVAKQIRLLAGYQLLSIIQTK